MARTHADLFWYNFGCRIILLLSQWSSSDEEDDKICHSLQNRVAKAFGATPFAQGTGLQPGAKLGHCGVLKCYTFHKDVQNHLAPLGTLFPGKASGSCA